MQCEICGKESDGTLCLILIDHTELNACPRCAKHGTEVKKQSFATATPAISSRFTGGRTASRTVTAPQVRHRRDMFDTMGAGIIDDYDAAIRKARAGKAWSQEQLAAEVHEKVTLIKKIERGEIVPEDSVKAKLERALDIRLTEGTDLAKPGITVSGSSGTTLGDIVKIRHK